MHSSQRAIFFRVSLALLFFVGAGIFFAGAAKAQGGPPFLTDDPATPGTNHWEINSGYIFNLHATPGEVSFDLPHIDVNYGLGPRLQLKYEAGLSFLKTNEQPLTSGMSNSLAGVKWRFVDEDKRGFSMSTYPQLEFNNPTSSVRRGIADEGTSFFLPLEVAKKFGPIETNVDAGYFFRKNAPDEISFGGLVGHQFSGRWELLGELHNTKYRSSGNELLFDAGGRMRINKHSNLLFMAGHALRRVQDVSPTWFGYFGIQLEM